MSEETRRELTPAEIRVVAEDFYKMSLIEGAPYRLLGRLAGEADFRSSQPIASRETLGLSPERIENLELFLLQSGTHEDGVLARSIKRGEAGKEDLGWLRERLGLERARRSGKDLFGGVEPVKAWYYPTGTIAFERDEIYRDMILNPRDEDINIKCEDQYNVFGAVKGRVALQDPTDKAILFVALGRSLDYSDNLVLCGYYSRPGLPSTRDDIIRELDDEIDNFKTVTLPGTRVVVMAGGKVRVGDKNWLDCRDYQYSIRDLGLSIRKLLGVEPVILLGPKTNVGTTNFYLDPGDRNLVVVQPEQDEVMMTSFLLSDMIDRDVLKSRWDTNHMQSTVEAPETRGSKFSLWKLLFSGRY